MQYGNCLLGACVLFLNKMKRKKSPKIIMRFRPESSVPHFMVKSNDQLYHYKLDRNVLFWPFCYMIFKGSFQTIEAEKEYLFMNKTAKMQWALSISLALGLLFSFFINK